MINGGGPYSFKQDCGVGAPEFWQSQLATYPVWHLLSLMKKANESS
jgi:hypothetical protein